MSSLSLSPFVSYAANAEQANRFARLEQATLDAANALRFSAAGSSLAVGSTITARYQYKVAADGALLPLTHDIIAEPPRDQARREEAVDRRKQRQPGRDGLEEGRARLGYLARPRASLSPSDELAIFAALNADDRPQPAQGLSSLAPHAKLAHTPGVVDAVDENGEAIDASLLTYSPGAAKDFVSPSLATRAQIQVAGLYARNNDIVYNATPISQLAA